MTHTSRASSVYIFLTFQAVLCSTRSFKTHQASSPKFPPQYLQIPNSIPSSLSSAVSFLMCCLHSQTARLCLCGDLRETRDICSIHLHDLSKTASSRSLSLFTSASVHSISICMPIRLQLFIYFTYTSCDL
ncbi:hypothetical protein B0H19DRAFT_1152367 [Mycena capillaripes]|nr:hypothetical protein B0H19DRAFT_1152367 [Mycena capillaripes]